MSKHIESIPLARVERIAIVGNPKGLTLEEAMAAYPAKPPDIGINGGYYNGDWSPASHLKANGVVLASETWGEWGYAWDAGTDIRMIQVPPGGSTPYANHITCKPLLTPWDGIDATMTVGKELRGTRGWTALALDGKRFVIWTTSDGADGITLLQLREELYKLGAETAMALDSGQSVKYRNKDGSVYITNPERPVVQNYIFIWLKEDEAEQPKTLYRVQVGAFGVKANAERLRDELSAKGYPGFITEVTK